jgi:rubrerythrin
LIVNLTKGDIMASSPEELAKILKTAIEVEENGLATFTRFADQTQDENGKRMFKRLAQDEQEHKAILMKQLKELSEGGSWTSIHIPASAVEQLLPSVRDKQKRTKGESGLGEMDALNTALDLERKAAQFFRDRAEEVSNPDARNLFLRLAEWEDAHFELIQAELDSIKNTGMWFGIPEFRMDGTY